MRSVAAVLLVVVALTAWLLSGRGADDAAAPPVDGQKAADGDTAPARLEGRPTNVPAPPPERKEGPRQGTGSLRVRVVVESSEKPIGGIEVHVRDAAGFVRVNRTDGRGEALFEGLPAAAAEVDANAAGWTAAWIESVAIVAGKVTELRLPLQQAVALEGIVTARSDGLPVAGACVHARSGGTVDGATQLGGREPYAEVRTDENGCFSFPAVVVGNIVTVRVEAKGFRVAERAVRATGARLVEFVLDAGGRIHGRLIGPDGEAVWAGVVIVAPSDDGEPDPEADGASSATSGQDGRYVVDSLPLDTPLSVQADAGGHACSVVTRDVVLTAAAPSHQLDLLLRAPASVALRVLDPDGGPAPGVLAGIGGAPFQSGLLDAEGATDEEGCILLDGLDPGKILVRTEAPGFLPWARRLELDAGERADLEMRLDPGAAIEGLVVDDLGRPVEGASVIADGPRWHCADVDSIAEGRFRLPGLHAGRPYRVFSMHHEHATSESVEVTPPAHDVRLVVVREARVKAQLLLPAGFEEPGRQRVTEVRDGGSSTSQTEPPWRGGRIDHTLRAGKVRLLLGASGLRAVELELDLEPGSVVDLGRLQLERPVRWVGVVVTEHGDPLPGATVIVMPHIDQPVTTDEDGRFQLPDPGPGTHILAVKCDGYDDRIVTVDTTPTAELRIVLALSSR